MELKLKKLPMGYSRIKMLVENSLVSSSSYSALNTPDWVSESSEQPPLSDEDFVYTRGAIMDSLLEGTDKNTTYSGEGTFKDRFTLTSEKILMENDVISLDNSVFRRLAKSCSA